MKELFLDYQLSLEMKEIGFDEPCFGWHSKKYLSLQIEGVESVDMNDDVLAPTYQQVLDFFREKHGIHIMFIFHPTSQTYGYCIYGKYQDGDNGKLHDNFIAHLSYQESLIQAIKESINIVKNKN